MQRRDSELELRKALESFETCLTTPVVSGELETWMDSVQRAWSDVVARARRESRIEQPALLRQMAAQDPELFSRVEQLRAESDLIAQHMEEISQAIAGMAHKVQCWEPDEGLAHHNLADLIKAGIDFVTEFRRHEVALQTWLMESFDRDLGTAD